MSKNSMAPLLLIGGVAALVLMSKKKGETQGGGLVVSAIPLNPEKPARATK